MSFQWPVFDLGGEAWRQLKDTENLEAIFELPEIKLIKDAFTFYPPRASLSTPERCLLYALARAQEARTLLVLGGVDSGAGEILAWAGHVARHGRTVLADERRPSELRKPQEPAWPLDLAHSMEFRRASVDHALDQALSCGERYDFVHFDAPVVWRFPADATRALMRTAALVRRGGTLTVNMAHSSDIAAHLDAWLESAPGWRKLKTPTGVNLMALRRDAVFQSPAETPTIFFRSLPVGRSADYLLVRWAAGNVAGRIECQITLHSENAASEEAVQIAFSIENDELRAEKIVELPSFRLNQSRSGDAFCEIRLTWLPEDRSASPLTFICEPEVFDRSPFSAGRLPAIGNVYIYGAGNGGAVARQFLVDRTALHICGFIDSYRNGLHEGLPVHSLNDYMSTHRLDSDIIVVASTARAEIFKALQAHGVTEFFDIFPLIGIDVENCSNENAITIEQRLAMLEEQVIDLRAKVAPFRMLSEYDRDDVVFVYQMGKVGSTAVAEALRRTGLVTFHGHSFRGEFILALQNGAKKRGNFALYDMVEYWKMAATCLAASPYMRKRLRFVTLCREPISHFISNYFQRHSDFYGEEYFAHSWPDEQVEEKIIMEMIADARMLITLGKSYSDIDLHFPSGCDALSFVKHWFELDFKRSVGVDLTSLPMDPRGFIRRDNILLLKMERLSELGDVLSSFTGRTSIDLRPSNEMSQRIGQLYRRVKARIRFPDDVLDEMYSWRWVQAFYSKEEIASFRRSWSQSE